MSETKTLVRFYLGWVEDGLSEDGMPRFKDQLMIILSRPPLLRLERAATEEEIEEYHDEYRLFEKEHAARKVVEGYPLTLWPACGEAEFKMLAARDIHTVEQLAKLNVRGAKNDGMPPELKDLAERAAKMVDLQKNLGKFEKMITEKDAELVAMKELLDEATATINTQKTVIDKLKISMVV